MSDTTPLKLIGREVEPVLPPLLGTAVRSIGQQPDPFLPPGYLRATATFDISPATRGVADGGAARRYDAKTDEVLVIELADGGAFITSAAKLKASLERGRPGMIGPDGEILFEQLRAEGAASRGFLGEAVGGLVNKVFALVVGETSDAIIDAAKEKLGNWAELGVTWAGTRALMWAIESRLDRQPGLYRWNGARGSATDFGAVDQAALSKAAAEKQPMLVFIHGTASSTLGSFGDLRVGDRDVWNTLERHYTGGIFAFEHRTLSESPIENALRLAEALPRGARISLVSHSRGGLVADLLCLENFDALIDQYRSDLPGTGDADADEAQRVREGLGPAHAEHRELLRKLATELRAKTLVARRYVRVASPARGTRLASGNFDLFLSGLLALMGQVPFFFGSPLYSAFKRVVLEIARNRTNPHLVPGIEAMLPDSPMARLLRDAPVRAGLEMAVIAGDIEGGNLLERLGVLLVDFLLFDNVDNDLVVDTASMLAGIAPQARASALFDRGADVSHFRYFTNADTRAALRDWLVADRLAPLSMFQPLPGQFEDMDALEEQARIDAASGRRGIAAADLPVVVILPGIMGSHLWVNRGDRVWFDPVDIAAGGLAKIAWEKPGVEAEKLFGLFYGDLCEHLAASHRVERFAYDWRQPLDVLAERLGEFLDRLMKETQQPIRLLAHSMGGLVARACIHQRRSVMDALMRRDGARFVMLGTPNQGAYSMVENLLGKGDTLRSLVRLDVTHDMKAVLDIVAGFRGALQLLPKPGFVDTFQGQPGGGDPDQKFQLAKTWRDYQPKVFDFWFGNGQSATPTQKELDAGGWLWRQDGENTPMLPEAYERKTAYVFGVARNTPCGVREEKGRLKMVGTTQGDGTVTWASGRIGGIGHYYYLPAPHGDLPSARDYFPALTELLAGGATSGLPSSPPATRAVEQPRPVVYDAGPPTLDGGDAVARGLMGGPPRNRVAPRPKRRLEVAVKAMDLRFLSQPILLGHYEQDPIAGPEALIDRELLDGDLSQRRSLGLYAGPRGTATVVLRAPNEQERRRGSVSGAVVTGLGAYDGAMNPDDLTESVRAGVLRYLLQVIDVLGKDEREMPLATLLLGYNSSANLSVGASVEALVRGVLEANARFHEATRLNIRVARLDIVELYLDTAITAVYALRQMPDKLGALARRHGAMLACRPELEQGEGLRQRLFDSRDQSYWPRLIVTDADRNDDECPPECFDTPGANTGEGKPAERDRHAAIADRLRFLYVGQRARAESVVQQRQPGLIEMLVRQQIRGASWQENFGRMLFQLMVPHDFKDAARQLERVVLVVDGYTANLPWELMFADDTGGEGEKLPLALRAPVVRQLATSRFRRHVRQGIQRSAFVVGNPSVEGFAAAFPDPRQPEAGDPPFLQGAETEATAVMDVLGGLGYQVARAIGSDCKACDVLAKLYQEPYRLVHVSAHGIFDQRHVDGRRRSGVVLSDGLLITAAEIAAMETVPELVFLSCCHLGQVDAGQGEGKQADRTVRDANKLAASVARELIEIGVRCVVVAGWAVNDTGAMVFGQAFYRSLLLERRPFGEAVFEARKAVWTANREDITWGAFQAYGEPGWLSEPRGADGGGGGKERYASPEELLDDLARLRADLSRKKERQTEREIAGQEQDIRRLLKDRCPPGWVNLPALQSALAATWAELGNFDQARKAYLAAVQAEDRAGRVPIRDIEQLANVEARLGEKNSDETMIDGALDRLRGLDVLVSALGGDGKAQGSIFNPERSILRGGAYKCKASLHAKQLLQPEVKSDEIARAGRSMTDALMAGAEAYGEGEGLLGDIDFRPYNALNRLALQALTLPDSDPQRDAAIALAKQCRLAAAEAYRRNANLWDAVMEPEALLVERLLDGGFMQVGDGGRLAFEEVARAYREALSNITVKPKELDSVVSSLCLLSRFCDALYVVKKDAGWRRMADCLIALAEQLSPGACKRDDRPKSGDEPPPAPANPQRKRTPRQSP
jgi:hypothetical protein